MTDDYTSLGNVNDVAFQLLKQQSIIPSKLLDVHYGNPCMCTGAAMLYAAHLVRGGTQSVSDFFSNLATETDDSFVAKQAHELGLDLESVRYVIINTKALRQYDRPAAVASILQSVSGRTPLEFASGQSPNEPALTRLLT